MRQHRSFSQRLSEEWFGGDQRKSENRNANNAAGKILAACASAENTTNA
jgi:hypothetical protein